MIAEIISIGDELTSGQRLDTNSQWLSQQLGELGIRVVYHTTVADDLAANVDVFRQAIARADIVIATGGLGPTADDLTRDVLALVIGSKLELHEESLSHIRQLFARHNRDMPERNHVQAMFPAGSKPIFNPQGTAPGIWIETARPSGGTCRLFALPGVPAEMRDMFQQTVAPALSGEGRVLRHRRIKCFGTGESHIERLLPDLIRRGREPSVGITVHEATITLRITASGKNADECYAAMQETETIIRDCLGNLVFGEEDDELEDAVIRLLNNRNQTLASVECGTQGLLAHWLGRAAGTTNNFIGSLVMHATRPLTDLWPDGSNDSGTVDPMSAEAAGLMARQCQRAFGADYGLAIGPFPERAPDSSTEPEFHFALATPDDVIVRSGTLLNHRSTWQPRAAKQALNLLRLRLLGEG